MISTLIKGGIFQLPGEEITWAGEGPENGSYCFGTESGKVFFQPVSPLQTDNRVLKVAEDAVNGVAFWGDFLGVSTRSEVVICKKRQSGDSFDSVFNATDGAHGILATPRGKFLVPMGTGGILCVDPEQRPRVQGWVVNAGQSALNFYKLLYVGDSSAKEIFACAARTDGLLTIQFDTDEPHNRTIVLRSPHLDFIDVCSLRSPQCPFAVVGLGIDRSLIFVRDLLGEEQPQSLRLVDFRGTPYAVLSVEGHLFVLTSTELIVLPDLVSRYLNRERLDRTLHYRSLPIQAVDASIVYGKDLLVTVDEGVKVVEIDKIIQPAAERMPVSASDDSSRWQDVEGALETISHPLERLVA